MASEHSGSELDPHAESERYVSPAVEFTLILVIMSVVALAGATILVP